MDKTNNILRNKKGIYFTIMTILFLIVFSFFFLLPSYKRLEEKMAVTEMRVDSMNNLIKDMKRDAERGLYISSYRSLLSLEDQVILSGTFIDDVEFRMKESLMNGTIYGENTAIMQASTFPNWIAKIENDVSKFNIDANISIKEIKVYQNDPWYVTVVANLSLSVKDATDIASWNRNETIETAISIIDFEDPLYIVNSYGRTTNTIQKTPYDGNYSYEVGSVWYVDNLLDHIDNSYYTFNENAPSFLMRFENNLGSSQYGIESLVNLIELNELGLAVFNDSSIVDYSYWEGADNGDYRVNSTPSWVKLDNAHRAKYNVTHLSYHVG
jgi:hypothetical protein